MTAARALVNSVEKGSPADKAAWRPPTSSSRSTASRSRLERPAALVGSTRPGSQSTLEVWRKGQTRKLNITVAELQEERVAANAPATRAKPQAEAPANRLGIVVGELSAEQKKGLSLARPGRHRRAPDSKADVRKGDVLLTLVHKGQHTELGSVEQFNKLLAGLDKNAVITLQVRRGESTAFVTISGLTDKG